MMKRSIIIACAALVSWACSDEDNVHSPLPTASNVALVALNEGHTGDLGGLSGADQLCLTQATAAGRPEKEWRAYLSTKAFNLVDLVASETAATTPVVNGNGEQIATSWAALMAQTRWSTSAYLYSFDGKRVDEGSNPIPNWTDADGWHGSSPGGVVQSAIASNGAQQAATCRDWTSDKVTDFGAAGELDSRNHLGQEIHPCNRTLAVLCAGALVLPSYGACSTPGAACPATDSCAVNPTCGDDGQCRPQSLRNCSDGLACTDDTCLSGGGCDHVLKPKHCLVNNVCYKDGEVDSTGCQVCKSSTSTTSLSTLESMCMGGTSCYAKGTFDANKCKICSPGSGTDGWVPRTDPYCTIGGQCQSKGDKHPQGCAECEPATSKVGWTVVGNHCLINDKCYSTGSKDPTGCNQCTPSQSKISWTPSSSNVCKIGGMCYLSGDKHPKGCAECEPATSVVSWTPKGNDCLINNTCYPPGSKDPTGCNQCTPAVSKTSWTPVTGSICKIGGKCYQTGAMHPQGCAACDPTYSTTQWKPISNDCLINDVCYPPKAVKPTGCGECNPALSKTSWSPKAGCWDIVLVALNNARTGNLGGVSGADALCAAQASVAGMSGTYQAFLSAAGRNVKDLISGSATAYTVTNSKGQQLFASWPQLFSSSGLFSSSMRIYSFDGKMVDENTGASPDWTYARNWHGSYNSGSSAGTVYSSYTCSNWTSSQSGSYGRAGELDRGRLLYSYTQGCNDTLAVVCVKTAP
jgi:hypothetical protein